MAKFYYVTIIDGPRHNFLLGPYENHQDAIDNVDRVRDEANERVPESWFYAFGTASIEADVAPGPGLFQKKGWMGLRAEVKHG